MQLKDKSVVVTGGASGIGRALVLELLARGARVSAADLNEEGLHETELLAGHGVRLSVHRHDITDRAACDALLADVIAEHGEVDVLINNAGIIQPFKPFAELEQATIDRVLRVNLYGTMNMVQAFLPALMARPQAHLANVSSMGAFVPFPGQTVYGASKAAVMLLTEGLYAELMDTDVGVSVILPGAVRTHITENSGVTGLGDADAGANLAMAPDRAAKAMLDGIEKGELHILVGKDAKLMDLAHRVLPDRSIRMIQKQMKKLVD